MNVCPCVVILLGSDDSRSMTSRAGSETLETGMEVSPVGSLIAPAGSTGGLTTTSVAIDGAEDEPAELVAVTRTRSLCPASAFRSAYVSCVASLMFPHPSPALVQRRHWKTKRIGVVPRHEPVLATRVEPT